MHAGLARGIPDYCTAMRRKSRRIVTIMWGEFSEKVIRGDKSKNRKLKFFSHFVIYIDYKYFVNVHALQNQFFAINSRAVSDKKKLA